jgi:hypothetical protein
MQGGPAFLLDLAQLDLAQFQATNPAATSFGAILPVRLFA